MIRLLRTLPDRISRVWYTIPVFLAPVILRAETNAPAETADASATTDTSLFELVFMKGGVFMYVILLLSIGMVYLIVDAILVTRAGTLMPEEQIATLKKLGDEKKLDEALTYCEDNPSPITRIVGAAIRVHSRGKTAMEEALAEHGAREVDSLRTRLSYLNTIATIAPMLGLLGTVSGMIKAFGNIAAVGMGKASVLADNISEALITTAGGLVIAIPAMAAFFFFRNRVNSLMVDVEDIVGEIVEKYHE